MRARPGPGDSGRISAGPPVMPYRIGTILSAIGRFLDESGHIGGECREQVRWGLVFGLG